MIPGTPEPHPLIPEPDLVEGAPEPHQVIPGPPNREGSPTAQRLVTVVHSPGPPAATARARVARAPDGVMAGGA